MRDLLIIIVILLIIIIGGICLQKYVRDSSNWIIEKIEKLDSNLNSKDITDDERKIAEEIYNDWHRLEKIWSIFVLHDELDLIETALINMKASIEVGDYNETKEKIQESKFLLNHIFEKEKLCLKNIF